MSQDGYKSMFAAILAFLEHSPNRCRADIAETFGYDVGKVRVALCFLIQAEKISPTGYVTRGDTRMPIYDLVDRPLEVHECRC